MIKIDYKEAQSLLKEGDILLFRNGGLIGCLIQRYTGGVHSHVAIVHKDGDIWQCVEFREFKGGRTVCLASQVAKCDSCIDVFRPVRSISYDRIVDGNIQIIGKRYTEDIAKSVTKDIIMWTGQPYGWKNIWNMFKRFIPFVRLFAQNVDDSKIADAKVCSTAVTVALRRNFMDPVPYLADEMVSPADLARSSLLQYLFTIKRGG